MGIMDIIHCHLPKVDLGGELRNFAAANQRGWGRGGYRPFLLPLNSEASLDLMSSWKEKQHLCDLLAPRGADRGRRGDGRDTVSTEVPSY